MPQLNMTNKMIKKTTHYNNNIKMCIGQTPASIKMMMTTIAFGRTLCVCGCWNEICVACISFTHRVKNTKKNNKIQRKKQQTHPTNQPSKYQSHSIDLAAMLVAELNETEKLYPCV